MLNNRIIHNVKVYAKAKMYAQHCIRFVTECSLSPSLSLALQKRFFPLSPMHITSAIGSYGMHIVRCLLPNEFIDIKCAIHYHF